MSNKTQLEIASGNAWEETDGEKTFVCVKAHEVVFSGGINQTLQYEVRVEKGKSDAQTRAAVKAALEEKRSAARALVPEHVDLTAEGQLFGSESGKIAID